MHIPKSFGTSLTEGLAQAIAPQRSVTGFDGVLFGAFDAFDTLGAAARAAIFLVPEALADADMAAGHFSRSTLRARYPDAQMMTVLREPVCRLLSLWLYWRGHLDEQLADWGAWGDLVRLSRLDLAAFLADARLACQTDNQALRMLLWPHEHIPENGFIDPVHDAVLLADAVDTLATFDFVDVAEDGLADRLQLWLGRPFVLEHRHETQAIPADLRCPLHRLLTQDALNLLSQRSRLDQQLWLSVARRCLPDRDAAQLAGDLRLVNLARFAALMC